MGLHEKCAVSVVVKGGGLSGQADAIKMGMARAVVRYDERYVPRLKRKDYSRADARQVEREAGIAQGASRTAVEQALGYSHPHNFLLCIFHNHPDTS